MVSKTHVLTTIALGLIAGAGTAHTFLSCPEASYPPCYRETLDLGFNTLEGFQLEIDHRWRSEGSLALTFKTNVECPVTGGYVVMGFPKMPVAEALAKGLVKELKVGDIDVRKSQTITLDPQTAQGSEVLYLTLRPANDIKQMFKADEVYQKTITRK